MKHYVFVDMSGSIVHNPELFAQMMGMAIGQGSMDIYGFSSDVFPYVFGDPLPGKFQGWSNYFSYGTRTDLQVIATFLSKLPSYPDQVTVISDGYFSPEDADARWELLEAK